MASKHHFDTHIYTVTANLGFQRSSLTMAQAFDLADSLTGGRVWYRDGSEVTR